jgi:ethanolamine phosphate phosphodiesterase
VDDNTYPRRGLAMWITQSVTDRYMRRNYQLLLKHQHPATIIFLGDLMDGGREWEDNKWLKEYNRFWNVFKTPEGVNVITTIPGNHDIGLGNGIQIDRLDRFKTHFTSVNRTSQCFRLGAFDIVLLDSPSLLSEDPLVSEAQLTFLERAVTKLQLDAGRLLFTHIPLWRHPDSNCGPQRESEKGIVMGGGYQYQNMLSEELSMKILDSCWPLTAIFSGDDHDYCVVNHTFEGRREKVPEYTVKSFSWAMVLFPFRHSAN